MKTIRQVMKLMLIALALVCVSCNSKLFNKEELELIPVQLSGDWGYINLEGKYVINPQFSVACCFTKEGLAAVCDKTGKWGYINQKGKYVMQPSFKAATSFNEGLALVVSEGEHIKCIDTKGEVRFVLPQAEVALGFSEGRCLYMNKEGKYGYANDMGKTVINADYESAGIFSEGLAAVQKDGMWGFIDKDGNVVIHPQFDEVGAFTEGLAFFRRGDRWGYIDKNGSYAINPQLESCTNFSEGLAAFYQDYKTGYINKEGKICFILASWEEQNSSVSLIAQADGVEINPLYNKVDEIPSTPQTQSSIDVETDRSYSVGITASRKDNSFHSGLALVNMGHRNGYINKDGNIIINPQYDNATRFYGEYAFVEMDGRWGIINKEGKYLVNPQFDGVKPEALVNVIASDYYDCHPFLKAFFDIVYADNATTFDGFGVDSTLNALVKSHHKYVAIDNRFTMEDRQFRNLTNDITLEGEGYMFMDNIYKKTNDNTDSLRRSKLDRYNLKAIIGQTSYVFRFENTAASKQRIIVKAFKEKLESLYNVTFTYDKEQNLYLSSDGVLGFLLTTNENLVVLYVDYTRNHFKQEYTPRWNGINPGDGNENVVRNVHSQSILPLIKAGLPGDMKRVEQASLSASKVTKSAPAIEQPKAQPKATKPAAKPAKPAAKPDSTAKKEAPKADTNVKEAPKTDSVVKKEAAKEEAVKPAPAPKVEVVEPVKREPVKENVKVAEPAPEKVAPAVVNTPASSPKDKNTAAKL